MASTQQSTTLLSAADVTWVRKEKTCIDVNVVATALDAKYFEIDAPASHGGANQEFFVFFDLDGASVPPAPAGKTAIEVDVVTGDTETQVATKLAAAVEANANFYAKVDPNDATQVLIEPKFGGPVGAPTTDVDTTFDIQQISSGLGGDLGKTSGGVELSMEASTIQITSDQTGAIPLDEVFNGSTVEASMSLLEMTPERWKTVVGSVTGDTFTPSGGTELVGMGTSRQYVSLFDLGGMLILHPTRYPASDRSYDITLFNSAPKPASIGFSGEEPQVMEVTFTALEDRNVNSAISLMAFGDSEQDVRA